MTMNVALFLVFVIIVPFVLSHSGGGHPTPMTSRSASSERDHIGHHLQEVQEDIHQMEEEELRFLYFQMHDSDHNNRLDGCELVKSLLHWHVEKHSHFSHGTTRVFGHEELAHLIDPILASDDKNLDGFIDYPEFVAAQVSRGF